MNNSIIKPQYCFNPGRIFALSLTALLLAGCATDRTMSPAANFYYLNPGSDLAGIGRVAVVELYNDSSYPQMSSEVTESLFQALQKKQVFGLTIVNQHDPSWRSLQLDLDSPYTQEQIRSIRETLKCDGILIGTITKFRPYPHMTVGLRMRLLDLRDGQLLWAIEQVWDSTDKRTEHQIRKYYSSEKNLGTVPLQEHLAAISPLEFLKYVSYEVAETL
jgi:hypothetical protein